MLSQAVAGVLFQTKIRRSSLILVSLGGGELSFLFAREWVIERQLKSPLCLPLMNWFSCFHGASLEKWRWQVFRKYYVVL